jgi:hypothetical protein
METQMPEAAVVPNPSKVLAIEFKESAIRHRSAAVLAGDYKSNCPHCHGFGLVGFNGETKEPFYCGCAWRLKNYKKAKPNLAPPPRTVTTKGASGPNRRRIRSVELVDRSTPTVHWPAKRLAKAGLRKKAVQILGKIVTIIALLDGSPWLPPNVNQMPIR